MKNKTRPTLAEAIDGFLAGEVRDGKSVLTVRNYRADLEALRRSAGQQQVAALNRTVLRHLNGLQIASRSWNRHLSTLRRFCDFLVQQRALGTNPLRAVERARVMASVHSTALTDITSMISRVDKLRDQTLITLLWQSGLRIREALSLRVRDLDLRAGVCVVRRGDDTQALQLTPVATDALSRYLAQRKAAPDEPVFTAHGRRPLSYAAAHRLFRQYAGDSGLTMQRLRASAATSAFDRGASLVQVQAMLGHMHAQSTVRYQLDSDRGARGSHRARKSSKTRKDRQRQSHNKKS